MLTTLFRSSEHEYTAALHSVQLINQLLDKPTRTESEFKAIDNNAKHLKTVLTYSIWTHENLDPIKDSIARVEAWSALGEEPAIERPIPPEQPSEFPWGKREPTVQEVEDYLVQLRITKDREINAERLAANSSFFTYLGKKIACDSLSRLDIDGANGYITLNGALPSYWPGGWKAMDNTYVPIRTVEEWSSFYTAMYNQGLMNFAKAQQLKEAIKNASKIEEIRKINW